MSRGLVAALAFALLGGVATLATAAPAKADSFSFGYSSGGYRGGPYWGRHYHRPPPPPRVVYYGPPPRPYYRPAPTVIYSSPPVVYAPPPPPQVVYAPQVVAPPIMATPGPVVSNSPYCREYQSTTMVGGQSAYSYGTACQQPDGSWRIVQ